MRSWTSFIPSSFNTHPRVSCQCFYVAKCTLSKISEFTVQGGKWSGWQYLGLSVSLFNYCQKTGIEGLSSRRPLAEGSQRNPYLSAWMTEARLRRGDTGSRPPVRTRAPGERCTPRPQPGGATERLFGKEIVTSPSPASLQGCWALPGRFEQRPEELGTAGPMLQLRQGRRRKTLPGESVGPARGGRRAAAILRGAAALRGGAGAGKLPEVSGCPSQPRALPPALALSPKAPTAPAD